MNFGIRPNASHDTISDIYSVISSLSFYFIYVKCYRYISFSDIHLLICGFFRNYANQVHQTQPNISRE